MMEKRLPDWLLERLALGDLPLDEHEALLRRLDAEEGGPERLAALERSNREILESYEPSRMAEAIRQRADGPQAAADSRRGMADRAGSSAGTRAEMNEAPIRRSPDGVSPASRPASPPAENERGWWRKLAVGGSFALPIAAAILIIALLPQGELPIGPAQSELEETRLKGLRPQLLVHRRGAEAPERLDDGAVVRPHELLQLSYVAAGREYGVVLSLDGSGVVTLHHPLSGGLASPLEREGAVPLPNAYELDDAPGFERFFFIFSADPFPVQEALNAARKLAASPAAGARDPLPLPSDREQTSLTLRKPR